MKILILVQSVEKEGYTDLIAAQKNTWDSIDNTSTQTVYYYPHVKDEMVDNNMYIKCSKDYYFMFNLAIEALKRCLVYDWDYIFKTDNSAYVHKKELVRTLQQKPRKYYYGGQVYEGCTDLVKWPFFWGEGVALSRDVVEDMVKTFDYHLPPMWYGAEDSWFGRYLMNMHPWDKSLIIYQYYLVNACTEIRHVYRCRDVSAEHDFSKTLFALNNIHTSVNILEKKKEESEDPPIITLSTQLLRVH